jgi:alanine racemase
MFQTSQIVLSKSALKQNFSFIKNNLHKGVKICSVVKGNAYGHGLSEYVQLAMKLGINYFAVHSAEEAYHLKKYVPNMPELFIMGSIENEQVDWAVENNIEFAVFDFDRLQTALNAAKKLNKLAQIHIEMETGMRRTGFEYTQIPTLCEWFLNNNQFLEFKGLFTHFAGAESLANHFRVAKQIENFKLSLHMFKENGLEPFYNHAACSAALLNYPESQGNMVRVGILQYGFWPNKETHIRFCGEKEGNPDLLKRVITWKTKVMAVKQVNKGCFIGYGTHYLAHRNMKIAVLPVGYSHGYSRNLSNVGAVLIHGKVCNVVGAVNMNSLTVDVTDAGNVEIGNEVVLIGKQNGKAITVSSFSEQSHQLNYELLTRLPFNIPRIEGG